MTANLNEAVQKIKKVGLSNTRVVPMSGQSSLDGKQQIEICEGGNWHPVVTGLTPQMAANLLAQASNRVILG
jgi:hypothetical protein